MNKKIKRDLELINYFGPHKSNCLVCKKRNMDFYTNSEPKQTMILLNYLKTDLWLFLVMDLKYIL